MTFKALALLALLVTAQAWGAPSSSRVLHAIGAANDVIINGGSGVLSGIAPGTSGNVLTSNGTSWTSSTPASAPTASYEISNVGVATSVGSNALTISLKQADGSSDCASGAGACKIGFRSSTASTGGYNQRSVTSSLSITISSGSTLGHISGTAGYLYLYVIDNAGTVELAVSSYGHFDTGSLVTTTAEGGAGAADDGFTLYSTTARSNVPARLLGRIESTQATAGTWASGMSNVAMAPFKIPHRWRVDANISGANLSLGTSAQSNYVGIENGSLTLTNNTDNESVVTAQIPCSGTNSPSGTTCSAGNESVGVSWNMPEDGDVRACASFAVVARITGSSDSLPIFQIVQTATNSQTVNKEGRSRTSAGVSATGAAGTVDVHMGQQVCGTFTLTSGQVALRLMYEMPAASSAPSIAADASNSLGQRDIHWEIYPIP